MKERLELVPMTRDEANAVMSAYPHAPGFTDPTTSREAAEATRGRAHALRRSVLALLRTEALTADECAARLGESILSIRPRLSELRADGLIAPTGERRPNASGLNAKVWRAVVRPTYATDACGQTLMF